MLNQTISEPSDSELSKSENSASEGKKKKSQNVKPDSRIPIVGQMKDFPARIAGKLKLRRQQKTHLTEADISLSEVDSYTLPLPNHKPETITTNEDIEVNTWPKPENRSTDDVLESQGSDNEDTLEKMRKRSKFRKKGKLPKKQVWSKYLDINPKPHEVYCSLSSVRRRIQVKGKGVRGALKRQPSMHIQRRASLQILDERRKSMRQMAQLTSIRFTIGSDSDEMEAPMSPNTTRQRKVMRALTKVKMPGDYSSSSRRNTISNLMAKSVEELDEAEADAVETNVVADENSNTPSEEVSPMPATPADEDGSPTEQKFFNASAQNSPKDSPGRNTPNEEGDTPPTSKSTLSLPRRRRRFAMRKSPIASYRCSRELTFREAQQALESPELAHESKVNRLTHIDTATTKKLLNVANKLERLEHQVSGELSESSENPHDSERDSNKDEGSSSKSSFNKSGSKRSSTNRNSLLVADCERDKNIDEGGSSKNSFSKGETKKRNSLLVAAKRNSLLNSASDRENDPLLPDERRIVNDILSKYAGEFQRQSSLSSKSSFERDSEIVNRSIARHRISMYESKLKALSNCNSASVSRNNSEQSSASTHTSSTKSNRPTDNESTHKQVSLQRKPSSCNSAAEPRVIIRSSNTEDNVRSSATSDCSNEDEEGSEMSDSDNEDKNINVKITIPHSDNMYNNENYKPPEKETSVLRITRKKDKNKEKEKKMSRGSKFFNYVISRFSWENSTNDLDIPSSTPPNPNFMQRLSRIVRQHTEEENYPHKPIPKLETDYTAHSENVEGHDRLSPTGPLSEDDTATESLTAFPSTSTISTKTSYTFDNDRGSKTVDPLSAIPSCNTSNADLFLTIDNNDHLNTSFRNEKIVGDKKQKVISQQYDLLDETNI